MDHGQTQDLEAVRAVIARETAAYCAKDAARWAACWLQNDQALFWHWFGDVGMEIKRGWPQIETMVLTAMRAFPDPMPDTTRRLWHHISVAGDMAWTTFDQHAGASDDPFSVAGTQHEMRILQRGADGWKLTCSSALKPRSEVMQSPALHVDAKARVLWMNAAARDGLVGHPGLTVSAGRLHGTTRAADKALEAAIAWAAGSQGYMQKHVSLRQDRAVNGAVPVLLPGGPTDLAATCWVQDQDGAILVSFDDAGVVARRLRAARGIFGLSPGQHELACLIALGHDLAQAAAEQGVSINTARTQLQRMFDKVGVRNQAALMRVLLSVGPPGL